MIDVEIELYFFGMYCLSLLIVCMIEVDEIVVMVVLFVSFLGVVFNGVVVCVEGGIYWLIF